MAQTVIDLHDSRERASLATRTSLKDAAYLHLMTRNS